MAIPAGTVLLVAAGGVLVYAGFTSQNPLAALKAVASGKPTPVRSQSGIDPASFTSTGGVSGIGASGGGIANIDYADVAPGEGLPSLPRAAERFAGDKYSQTNRWANGYSDCSSFVGKALKVIGIRPPGGSTTGAYLASKDWKRIPESQVQAGDLAMALNHAVICYGNGYGIGQQSRKTNVKRGTVKELMYGQPGYVYLRYAGAGSSKSSNVAAT